MYNAIKILALVTAIACWFPPPLLGGATIQEGVMLEGRYIGPEKEDPVEPVGEEAAEDGGGAGNVSALADLPVIEPDLMDQVRQMDPIEYLRVIIFLDYQPQDVIAGQVREKYASKIEDIRQEARAINARFAGERRRDLPRDSENYDSQLLEMDQAEKNAMRDLNARNEALALAIQREIAARLKTEVESHQSGVKAAIEQLGGEVEFGTTAGNAIIARVPAGSVAAIADIDAVARVVGDRLMEQHLTIADDATLVKSTKTGGGLWDNGQDGGAYDPAVLDSGTDLDHPGLEDATNRENHWSWYLVAASAHPDYADYTGIDDRNGHGTHVMGIVGSYGTSSYPNHLGMAFGVEKAVHLKAGFNKTNGRASMYQSDAMWLVDRALYHQEQLFPVYGTDDFQDDVDGINLSYGGETTEDETDYSRFWDSVVSGYPDTVVTLSAGNDGPGNTIFASPACSYNAITVAAVDDQNTASRDDDTIASYSTRGPTANGRRKPDIAAPGSNINSCNTFWETQSDYIDKDGTSMAAPMIQGLAMDLMDAGVFDEKEIKALLINHAQKNEPGINFESDADGWSEAYGWGYVNAWASYYHRADVNSYTVTERNTVGDYVLLSGPMRDEGSGGEGRDRATMVWNRHASYNPTDFPTSYHALSDLNLRLYREADNVLIDSDLDADDNVHQVRVNSGTSATDMVIKAYAWSTDFPNGGTTETFALATEEDFVQVDLPADFQAWGGYPTEMEPNEEGEFEWWMDNESDIASHANQFDLVLPTGWTRVSGADPYIAGSVAAGGTATHATWILRAQATPQDGVHVNVDHTHNSYGEAWGPHRWYMAVNVRWDTTPPSPNPMTWATEPYAISTSQIRMVATTATDLHLPVAYYFLCVTANGHSSGWQTSTTYTDSGLPPNTWCGYRVMARDSATTPNYTAYSSGSRYAYTLANVPGVTAFSNISQTSIRANWTTNGNPDGTQYLCENITAGTNSGWVTTTSWNSLGLNCGTSYSFRVKARNGNGVETAYRTLGSQSTLACDVDPPVIDDIDFDACISECLTCPDAHIVVTAHDPAGGTLSYAWTPLNGGTMSFTAGAVGDFDPPDSGPHPCPYHVRVQATSSISGLTATQIVPITVKLTGDVGGDGVVNILDKVAVRNAFGASGPPGTIPADVNCDGVVNILDKVIVRNQFGLSGCVCP